MNLYLKNRRLQAVLTQQQASSLLGYQSSQFLSNLERGLSKPPVPVLIKMCQIYGIPETEMKAEYVRWVQDEAARKAEEAWEIHKESLSKQPVASDN